MRAYGHRESRKEADAIELASASLIAHHANIATLLPAIAARRDHWTSAQGKPTDLDLLLATGYVSIGDGPRAKTAAEALLKDWPDSVTAMRLAGSAYALDHNWAAWNSLLDGQLAKHPNDRELLWERARAAQAQGDFTGAGKFLHTVLDGGQGRMSSDYNFYSWNTLFEKSADTMRSRKPSRLIAHQQPQLRGTAYASVPVRGARQDHRSETSAVTSHGRRWLGAT